MSLGLLAGTLGAMLGATIGSFLATTLIRWPAGGSPLVGRSHCDTCGRTLRALDLVPLLSFAWNRGRCRICLVPIDHAHFWIELSAAAIGAAAFVLAPPVAALAWAGFGWGLLLLATLDWRHFWLPDVLTFSLAVSGLALGQLLESATFVDRLIGLATGYGALWLVARVYRRLRRRDGMGGGDPKLFAAIGAWLGWQTLPFVLLAASSLGVLLVAIAAARGRSVSATTVLPLGSLICLAALPGYWGAQVSGIG